MVCNILINNVEIFNGKDEKTIRGNILIQNNLIEKISIAPILSNEMDNKNLTIIDGKGKFLMPGLIDAHWHSFLSCNKATNLLIGDISYAHLVAGKEATQTLQRGFTTVRDAGGPVFGLKEAIDTHVINGPRIYPSGAMISQTSGHGDFRAIHEVNHTGCGCGTLAYSEEMGVSRIVDGPNAVTMVTRENLRLGASQIKLMVGGGAASFYDPLDVNEFFEEEIKAAVEAASDWGTYVMTHVYHSKGIIRAVKAGVKSIEHGHLMDEETMETLADNDVWLSMQAFSVEDNTYPSPIQQAKHLQICNGTDNTYKLAKKYNVKLAWGTDLLFNPENTKNQNKGIVKLKKWFSNYEILKMVTFDNAQIVAMSGARNPYPQKLGVIQEGAYADILLIDGNVLNNIDLLGDPTNNILLVMKNGIIYKNQLKS